MTVAALKTLIGAAKTETLATIATELNELKTIFQGQTGATPAQLDEIGVLVTDYKTATGAAVQGLSDQVAGTPPPNPIP